MKKMICKICNNDKDDTLFYKHHKICKVCKENKLRCKHDKRKTLCLECGGKSLCNHNRIKYNCKECKGKSLCSHDRIKNRCRDCGGASICEHNIEKYSCKKCKGGSICNHNRIRSKCRDCNGGSICEHNKERTCCKECRGGSLCIHDKRKSICKICKGIGICDHNINKIYCKKCKGSQICPHNKFKRFCILCCPNSIFFCKSCRLFRVNKRTNYLCSYCNGNKTRNKKIREISLKTFLENNNYMFIYNRKCNIDNSCQTYYPDFVIDCNTFFIIIECDEDSHKSYDKSCEKIRENNICYSLGLPCVFIRFNPDKKGIGIRIKYTILKSYIEYYKNKHQIDNVVEYLFYESI